MTDVLKIALDRRAQLHDEVAKLNEFIRYAESLLRTAQNEAADSPAVSRTTDKSASESSATESADAPRPSIIRRGA